MYSSLQYYNTIGNLQLLTNSENKEKSAKDFDKWISTRDDNFKERHSIPSMQSYSFDNFLEFVKIRRTTIEGTLKAKSDVLKETVI